MSARIGIDLVGAQTFKFIRDKPSGQRPPVCSIIGIDRFGTTSVTNSAFSGNDGGGSIATLKTVTVDAARRTQR
jgi:hypothetical protein